MSTVEKVKDAGGKPNPADGDEDFERAMADPPPPGSDPRPQDGDVGLDPPPVPPAAKTPPGHDDAGDEGPPQPVSNGVPAGNGVAPSGPVDQAGDPPPPLADAVEEALATGDPASVQRLVTRDGRDPFAVATLLDETVERLWAEAGDDPTAIARAEAAAFAADAVRVGRGPVTFAIALDYTLRDAGVLAPSERITSLDQARARVLGAPEAQDVVVREALLRAEVGSGVLAADYGVYRTPPVPEPPPPPPPYSLPDAVPQEALTQEVAEALATGDPLAVQRLVSREGRDAFAVAHVLEDAVEHLWDVSLDSPDGLDRAERAEAALDGVRMGRGPVSFALALEYTLRDVGALGKDEEITSLDQARSVVDAAPDDIAYEVRDAIARAEVASGLLATEDFGIAHDVPDPGPGLIEDLAALAVPGALTYGWQLPKWTPVQGAVLVIVPNGEAGLNEPGDFTTTDGDGRNTILVNLRLEGAAGRDLGRYVPGAGRFRTVTITFEPEQTRLAPFLRGEAPLFGENGLIPSVEVGGGYVNPSLVPGLPGGLERGINGPSLVGNIRGGYVSEDNQRVYNVNFALNMGVDTIVAMAGAGVAGVSAVVPGGQGVAATSAGLAVRAQGIGESARRTTGVPVGGAAWSLEVRFNTADHADGPGFDGVYYNGERVGLLSDGVQASLEVEARARGITVEELVESGQAEDAIMRGLGGMTR